VTFPAHQAWGANLGTEAMCVDAIIGALTAAGVWAVPNEPLPTKP
jgi:hypothetical protein